MRNLIHTICHTPRNIILAVIDTYQRTLSPDHGAFRALYPYGFCRHHPTCSEFARCAILEKGALCGSLLSLHRILSCTPWKRPMKERIVGVCYGEKKFYEKLVS